jgi:hypothetical protein
MEIGYRHFRGRARMDSERGTKIPRRTDSSSLLRAPRAGREDACNEKGESQKYTHPTLLALQYATERDMTWLAGNTLMLYE